MWNCASARRTTIRPWKNGMWSRWCRAASRWIKPTVMECEVGGRRSKSRWIKPKGKLNSVFFSFFYLYATASVGLLRENFHFFNVFFHMNVKIFHKWKWKKMFFLKALEWFYSSLLPNDVFYETFIWGWGKRVNLCISFILYLDIRNHQLLLIKTRLSTWIINPNTNVHGIWYRIQSAW